MPRSPLSKKSATIQLNIKLPAALKNAIEKKLDGKETLSACIRRLLEREADTKADNK